MKTPTWSALGFQSSYSVISELAVYFHDYVCLVLLMITILMVVVIAGLVAYPSVLMSFSDSGPLEVWWTILPGIILLALAGPSLKLLYLMDEVESPDLSLIATGHQWYWEYSYPDFSLASFESYMLDSSSEPRLLSVDSRVVLPYQALVRVLGTSSDVLHSWALPGAGVKVDVVPGRINQLSLSSWAPGVLYGQCSEICGANHSFMPIGVEFIPASLFVEWVKS